MTIREHFQQAAWQEPLITELGSPGLRGVAVPRFDGPSAPALPEGLRRPQAPALPEMSQPHVLRHFMRLSQMTLAHNIAIDAPIGTTTPKYPPVVNELITRQPKLAELHPSQPIETVQGILQLLFEFGECLKALSGMDAVAMQPGGGAHAIFANVQMIRAYHASRGDHHRDEMISTLATHPTNPAAASAAGFKIIEIPPSPSGSVDIDAVKAAVSERTAGLFLNNPEDTGVFNVNVDKIAEIVHQAGGLCSYDQANANATLGLARARESGFDLAHFNIHKTFGAPMNLFGPAAGVVCVTSELEPFLPTPLVVKTDDAYTLDFDRPQSIGPIRAWQGNIGTLVKGYAWLRSMGEEWIREVSRIAALNNNYVQTTMENLRGVSVSFPENTEKRIDVVRYSLEKLQQDTGFGAEDLNDRMIDYGISAAFTAHHPYTSPEPFTLEPTESFDRDELDELTEVYSRVVDEAYDQAETIATAPHRGAKAKMHFQIPAPGEVPLATARLLREHRGTPQSTPTTPASTHP
ncbi:aminomethyl-transferring glycine dehydrogenase subunit GcvPB [Rhodococcus sp. T2V]|uniref:aminomethyl-transferring glycine dehydrogenase subunit GcvPB n=1 Tax=Rhodococcus sp. T2V TaxID=3034164 RepID=UPI0023E0DB5B|nr:aminomethyl-transferring glycine dehydrogenase subunit GcvPB [Rhodococcus sp. T2V]MDF3311634.1 aminomethyl-transferring glycine dehydrogenase subunit GcvPB [Rhodococcus sp. T2V]